MTHSMTYKIQHIRSVTFVMRMYSETKKIPSLGAVRAFSHCRRDSPEGARYAPSVISMVWLAMMCSSSSANLTLCCCCCRSCSILGDMSDVFSIKISSIVFFEFAVSLLRTASMPCPCSASSSLLLSCLPDVGVHSMPSSSPPSETVSPKAISNAGAVSGSRVAAAAASFSSSFCFFFTFVRSAMKSLPIPANCRKRFKDRHAPNSMMTMRATSTPIWTSNQIRAEMHSIRIRNVPTTEHIMLLLIWVRVNAPGPSMMAMYRELVGRQKMRSSPHVDLVMNGRLS
mmetsp:Transcript_11548/g.33189  ORF Transcript_11548/g.33189 Transcript_11548/m.33189 type:complete len:285 (+) Transcript_11548:2762-3616(+)